jgi:hypothetical protein
MPEARSTPRLNARYIIGCEERPRKKLAILVLVEPRTFNVEELETRHAAGKWQGVDGELRDRLIRPGVGFVVEDVHRAIPDLQKINMAGEVAGLVRAICKAATEIIGRRICNVGAVGK